MLSDDGRGARDQVLMEHLVLFGADGVAESIAEDGIELGRVKQRRGILISSGHGGGLKQSSHSAVRSLFSNSSLRQS